MGNIALLIVVVLCLIGTNAGRASADQPIQNPVIDISCEGISLVEAINKLRSASGANIAVNWKALEAVRVQRDLPVTYSGQQKPIHDVLQELLKSIGGDYTTLGVSVQDDVYNVSTVDDLAGNVVAHAYDIRHLLPPNGPEREVAIRRLTNCITGIDPLSWRSAGAKFGQMRIVVDQLVVTQTPETHQKVQAWLEKQREKGPLLSQE